MPSSTMPSPPKPPIHVAIIGGGITGVILALGLQHRNIPFTLYERLPALTELGAGIGFSPNAERALALVDPEVHRVYKRVAPTRAGGLMEYFQWADGHGSNEVVARLAIGVDAFQGGRRADFVEAWAALVEGGRVRFGMELVDCRMKEGGDGRVVMRFADGEEEEADVVIGCDGIHSLTRRLILGPSSPSSRPSYTGKYCYRSLVPMAHATALLGPARTTSRSKSLNRFLYLGPDAHVVTYPVARDQFLNVLLVVTDPDPTWRGGKGEGEGKERHHTAPGDKEDALRAVEGWNPAIRALVGLLPDALQKWAIFDMHEHPAPRYYGLDQEGGGGCGCGSLLAVAGDAAHAAGPHLGSGAGFGVEDALVLAELLEAVGEKLQLLQQDEGEGGKEKKKKADLCRAALVAYNNVRYERTQWLPGATRAVCALFHGQNEAVRRDDWDTVMQETSKRFHTIWDYDVGEMVEEARREFEKVVGA